MSTVTSSYSVARRPAGANQLKSRSEIARSLGPSVSAGASAEVVKRSWNPVLVDSAAADHGMDGVEHRRRPAHVHVGIGQLLVDRLVHEAPGHRRVAEVGQPLPERGDLFGAEQVALFARPVIEAHRALAPFVRELAQHAEHRRHPRAAGDHQDWPLGAPQVEVAVRPGHPQPGMSLDLIPKSGGEAAAGRRGRVSVRAQPG